MNAVNNPFPGMNPYFEASWYTVHPTLITYIQEQLSERLPADLIIRTEEGVAITDEGEPVRYRADVAVIGSYSMREEATRVSPGGVEVADHFTFGGEPETDRWIEVREPGGRLVTVIELLSPWNKTGKGRVLYLAKRRRYLMSRVSLVEMDLLRAGEHTVAFPLDQATPARRGDHWVCVHDAALPGRVEVYPLRLREPIRAVEVPLRLHDPRVLLELQPLIDRCFKSGRYWLEDHRLDPEPPLSEADSAWTDALLRTAGLR